jgi:hypothetical protein
MNASARDGILKKRLTDQAIRFGHESSNGRHSKRQSGGRQ